MPTSTCEEYIIELHGTARSLSRIIPSLNRCSEILAAQLIKVLIYLFLLQTQCFHWLCCSALCWHQPGISCDATAEWNQQQGRAVHPAPCTPSPAPCPLSPAQGTGWDLARNLCVAGDCPAGAVPAPRAYNPWVKLLENPETTNTSSWYLLSDLVFTFRASHLKTLLCLKTTLLMPHGLAALLAFSLMILTDISLFHFAKSEVFQVPYHQRIHELSPTALFFPRQRFLASSGGKTQHQDQRPDAFFLHVPRRLLPAAPWCQGSGRGLRRAGAAGAFLASPWGLRCAAASIPPPRFWFMLLKTRLLLALCVFG